MRKSRLSGRCVGQKQAFFLNNLKKILLEPNKRKKCHNIVSKLRMLKKYRIHNLCC